MSPRIAFAHAASFRHGRHPGTHATGRLALLLFALLWAGFAQAQAQAQRVAAGTGFFVTADGYFVTCFHVVVGSNSVTLSNLKGERVAARIVMVDRNHDLALLKAEGSFRPLPIAASATVRRGTAIVTMGFPNVNLQGIEPKVTDGIVNSFSGANNDPRVFQVSAPVQPGNSGGPLVTMEGNVVGVVASKLDAQAIARQTGDIPQNVNYAIKSQHLQDLLARAAQTEPRLRDGLLAPRAGAAGRVVDIVPALEDAIALVLATSGAPEARPPRRAPTAVAEGAPGAVAPGRAPDDRVARAGLLVAEFRQLQRDLNRLNFDELTLINQSNALKLMLRFEPATAIEQRQAELSEVTRRLEDIGTRKAEAIRRMNELSAQYRQLESAAQGRT